MTQPTAIDQPGSKFYSRLPTGIEADDGWVIQRLLSEYGAVFVAGGGVVPPQKVVFEDSEDVENFQSCLEISSENVGGIEIELQSAAMNALLAAAADAKNSGLTITPRGPDAARRTYEETVGLWHSRVQPALDHWVALGELDASEAKRIASCSPFEQVPIVLCLEEKGIYFSKDLSKSIMYSVAPPGTSQHLSMLALDVTEFDDAEVRSILARHGWFQTVVSDLPHFTFLGHRESLLPDLGLKPVRSNEREFWVPDI